MQRDRYALRARVAGDPQETERRVREVLAAEGFGVLTEIDVQATLRQKIGVETEPYRILGACNPGLAHTALGVDPALGALLPCSVVVRAHPEGGSEIIAVDAETLLGVAQAPELAPIAREVAERLERVVTKAAS